VDVVSHEDIGTKNVVCPLILANSRLILG